MYFEVKVIPLTESPLSIATIKHLKVLGLAESNQYGPSFSCVCVKKGEWLKLRTVAATVPSMCCLTRKFCREHTVTAPGVRRCEVGAGLEDPTALLQIKLEVEVTYMKKHPFMKEYDALKAMLPHHKNIVRLWHGFKEDSIAAKIAKLLPDFILIRFEDKIELFPDWTPPVRRRVLGLGACRFPL